MKEREERWKFINIFLFLFEAYIMIIFVRYIFWLFDIDFIPGSLTRIFILGFSPLPAVIHIIFMYETIFYQDCFSGWYKNLLRVIFCLSTAAFIGIWIIAIFQLS